MPVKKNNIFEKMYDILVILVNFGGNFPWYWLIFCYQDPADQNTKEPNGSGSETQVRIPGVCKVL